MTSDWRGEGRKTPARRRSRSKREAPVAIISIAQQASPKVIGQGEDLRAQLKSQSAVVVKMLGSNLPCRTPIDSLRCLLLQETYNHILMRRSSSAADG